MRGLRAAFADLWYLSRPYFTSAERKSAWTLLGVVLGLTLLLVGADVLQSFSRNIFYTALQQRDVTSFLRGLFWFVRTPTMPIPGFFIIAVRIPEYFLWIALLYSLFASVVTHLTGRRLIPLRIALQKAEADFRYSLVHTFPLERCVPPCATRLRPRLSDDRLCVGLAQVGLPALIDDHDTEARWTERLSPEEQQRLMFGRVLLNQPEWVFLDESTSNLDAASENQLYDLLRECLPSLTTVSVTHRTVPQEHHPVMIDLRVFAPSH